MADETRRAVASRLTFANKIAEDDLYEEHPGGGYKVHTHTVALLDHLTRRLPASHRLLVTALHDDHGDSRPGDPWSHRGGGAADLWIARWAEIGDYEIDTVLRNLAVNPWVLRIGFGGASQPFFGAGYWPERIIRFYDNSTDHVHVETGPGAPYS